jgi:ankyrin repeat protein
MKIKVHVFYLSILCLAGCSNASVNYNTPENHDKLIWAVYKGNYAKINDLLNKGVDINRSNRLKNGTLHICMARNDDTAMLKFLLDHGANMNMQNYSGQTRLMNAVTLKQYKCVKMLLKRGANKKIKNRGGAVAFDFIYPENDSTLIYLLSDKN